jgi:hypothetical protein
MPYSVKLTTDHHTGTVPVSTKCAVRGASASMSLACRAYFAPRATRLRAKGYGMDEGEVGLPLVHGRSHDPLRGSDAEMVASPKLSPEQPAAQDALVAQAAPATALRTTDEQPLVRLLRLNGAGLYAAF